MGLWKSFHLILMHFFLIIFQCFKERLHQILLIFKNSFFYNFNRSSLFFDQSKLRLKVSVSLCLFWLIETVFSINRISWIRFFKIQCLTRSKHFFKRFFNFSLSLRLGKAKSSNFCRFPPNLLQGFPLPKPVSPFYPFFCILFHVCMHKFMHLVEIFGLCINWDFCLIKPYFMKLINGFCFYIDIFMI